MVRWTEQEDGYLLRVSKAEEAAACALVALLFGAAGILVFWRQASLLLHPCVGCPVVGMFLLAVLVAFLRWEYSAWVLIPLRGGLVRWGMSRHGPREPLQVRRFEMEVVGEEGIFSRRHHHVVAVTDRGDRVRVLGYWESVDAVRVQGIVERLNQLLVTEEQA